MILLDPIARASTIALLAAVSLALMRDLPRNVSARTGVAFFSTIAAYLVLSSPDYPGVRGLDVLLQTAAFAAPAAFWLFSRALFDDDRTWSAADGATVAALVAIGFARMPAITHRVASVLYYVASIGLVAFALAQVVRGLHADLVEPRRRLRAVFTIVVGFEILTVLGAEMLLAGSRAPRLLELIKSLAAFWLTLLFSVWFLSPKRELFGMPAATGRGPSDTLPALPAAADEVRFRERLLTLMRRDKIYRQEGLTIGLLARKLDLPEYRLRRIINQQLGYRNFNAFLNAVRIEEACRILSDPAHERLAILNLALDLGYGSLGPFNRAFRSMTGQTPTEYRRARLNSPRPRSDSPAES